MKCWCLKYNLWKHTSPRRNLMNSSVPEAKSRNRFIKSRSHLYFLRKSFIAVQKQTKDKYKQIADRLLLRIKAFQAGLIIRGLLTGLLFSRRKTKHSIWEADAQMQCLNYLGTASMLYLNHLGVTNDPDEERNHHHDTHCCILMHLFKNFHGNKHSPTALSKF